MITFVGIILLFVALAAFLTTSERIRQQDYSGSRTPLMAWGILAFVLAAVIGYLGLYIGGGILVMSFGELLAGILFFLSHSQMIPPPSQPPEVRREHLERVERVERRVDQARTEVAADTTLLGIASLQCKNGADRGSTFRLGKGRATIGRGEGNDVKLEDTTVSRTHAEITYDGRSFAINDLGSSNGTYVDGTAVPTGQPRKLREGAQIKLGEELFLFSTEEKTQLV